LKRKTKTSAPNPKERGNYFSQNSRHEEPQERADAWEEPELNPKLLLFALALENNNTRRALSRDPESGAWDWNEDDGKSPNRISISEEAKFFI
jgi:hypothetical protein